jgi:stage II sporulation protein D
VVDEDTYIKGVLTGEAEAGSLEALKALAVAAHSMLPFLKGRHKAADVCDLTHCQVYAGVSESTVIAEAVRTTRGCVLMAKGKVALTPYHSTCGGITSPANGFFDVQAPHLRGVKDEGICSLSPHFHWELTLEPATIAKIFGMPGPVTNLQVTERDSAGRVRWLTANGRQLSGAEFYRRAGRALGWNVVKSTLFSVDREDARYRIRGRGLGHGVGLCQWGAEAMARRGHTFEEILAFYFPGIRVNCAATSGEIPK